MSYFKCKIYHFANVNVFLHTRTEPHTRMHTFLQEDDPKDVILKICFEIYALTDISFVIANFVCDITIFFFKLLRVLPVNGTLSIVISKQYQLMYNLYRYYYCF